MFRRSWLRGLALCAFAAGCASGPGQDNPIHLRSSPIDAGGENPVLIAPGEGGPVSYADVFVKVLSVLDDHFRIAYSNRYDGRIVTLPATAGGLCSLAKVASPDLRERLLATTQSYRFRAEVLITSAPQGGYLVEVVVYRELEDLPVPISPSSNPATFTNTTTVDRTFEVVVPEVVERAWIPKGRDCGLEQVILAQIRACQ